MTDTSRCQFVVLLVAALTDVSLGIVCFNCTDVSSARDCPTVAHCGTNQVCYNEYKINTNGHIYRHVGCQDRNLCPGSILGRRKRSASGGITVCEECCDTDFCQTKICGDVDYPSDRGHLCYNCDNFIGSCDQVKECSRDEVCYMSLSGIIPSNTHNAGCMARSSCHQIQLDLHSYNITANTVPQAGQIIQSKCFTCCDKDICNTRCGPQVACQDTQTLSVCQQAQQYVCHDKDFATNAGCLKTCGFCP